MEHIILEEKSQTDAEYGAIIVWLEIMVSGNV